METRKAHERRCGEGFFERYCTGRVLDVGCGRLDTGDGEDLVVPHALGWDKDMGDATFLDGLPDESFDTVYASHVLEHLSNPWLALLNWRRVLRLGGHLIISVPHRDLYEKSRRLPSRWNPDHKFFVLPDQEDLPHTLSLRALIEGIPFLELISMEVKQEGWEAVGPDIHSPGEYSIEAIAVRVAAECHESYMV